jgi:MSHA biogenesis protein MshG
VPVFTYKSRNAAGELQIGSITASTKVGVADLLLQQGLMPIDIQVEQHKSSLKDFLRAEITPKRIKIEELTLFCRQMYTMLRAGVPIMSALRRLLETSRDKSLCKIIQQVVTEIASGRSLSVALQQHPRVFKPLMVSIVEAGEQSGQMEESFLQLSNYFELENETFKKLKAAMRYPMVVIVAVFAGIGVLNFMVIPAFAKIFTSFHKGLPLPTQIIFAVSQFFLSYWWVILIFAILLFFGIKFWLSQPSGRLVWDRIKLKIPVFGHLLNRMIMARFSRVFSMLLHAGVPLVKSVDLLSRAVGNAYVGSVLLQMKESIERGESLEQAATKTDLFPKMIIQMIAIGEEAGAVDDMLQEVARFYDREVAYDMARLADLIQPFLTLIMGGMVLVLALGVFLPMWNMISFVQAQ